MMRSSLTRSVGVQLLTLKEFTKSLPISRPLIYQEGARVIVPTLAWQRTVTFLPTFSTSDAGVISRISVSFSVQNNETESNWNQNQSLVGFSRLYYNIGAFKNLRRLLQRKRLYQIELCGSLSILPLFFVGQIVPNGQSVVSIN